MVAEQGLYLMPLNHTLKNGKFYVMHVYFTTIKRKGNSNRTG